MSVAQNQTQFARLFVLLLAVSVSVQALPGVSVTVRGLMEKPRTAYVMARGEAAQESAPRTAMRLARGTRMPRIAPLVLLLLLAAIQAWRLAAYGAAAPRAATPQALRVRMND